MEERWDPERDDPEVVALLEAFLVNHVFGNKEPVSFEILFPFRRLKMFEFDFQIYL